MKRMSGAGAAAGAAANAASNLFRKRDGGSSQAGVSSGAAAADFLLARFLVGVNLCDDFRLCNDGRLCDDIISFAEERRRDACAIEFRRVSLGSSRFGPTSANTQDPVSFAYALCSSIGSVMLGFGISGCIASVAYPRAAE